MGIMWLSFSRKGILAALKPCLIRSELDLMLALSSSDSLASSMLFMEAAAIDGFMEEVKMNPGAKLLM